MTSQSPVLKYNFKKSSYFDCINFTNRQVTNFTDNWFQAKDPIKAQKISALLQDSELVKELATNPLLLKLLCLVFEETASIPANRVMLYDEGIDILLKTWNVSCYNREQSQIYKKLLPHQKKDLLSSIALKTFERSEYYFEQKELEQYIADYIFNLPDAQTESEALQLDSKAVLQSIEAQHGLLVERKKGIYSFSHFTFHEYFAVREILDSPNPQTLEKALQNLAERVTELHWREIFLLAVGLLRNADYLLRLMKKKIDKLVTSDKELQQLLIWVNQKSNSFVVGTSGLSYKSATLRALTLEHILNLNCHLTRALDKSFNPVGIPIYIHKLQNWQFNRQQKQTLRQYYNANKLLVDCLNNARYVTRKVREEIEETLLLPSQV
jgi:predicted NACHT family NTPase